MIGMWENSEPGILHDGLRSFCTIFDGIATTLLGGIYKVFFLVANATIISGDVIKVFYSRIQLILGILMIFKLAMSILNIIINPDVVKDQKNGPGKMVTRIVAALFMLTLVIPINIPNATAKSLNAYINDHGILFGVLYKAQDSILSENILAKLILGTSSNADADDMDVNNLSDIGNSMASTVLKVFVRINVNDDTLPACDYASDDDPCSNTVCAAEVNESHYAEENVDPQVILSHINDSCGRGSDEKYAFEYTPIIGALVMLIMALIITGFTVDIVVRAIKLAVLRLVAPVPIISYINPPKQGGGAFDNWTKSLISTYVDLFVRLAIVYFGLFMIQIIMNGGMDIFGSNVQGFTFTSGIAFIFIILGILVFMRQAPQFIRDILGIKGKPMGNVGLSSMMAGTASLLGGAGLAGAGAAAMGAFGAAREAAAQGKPAPSGWVSGRDLAAQLRTGDSKARGGIVNAANQRLQRASATRFARRYGVTGEGVEVAKGNMYKLKDQADKSKDLYDRFLKGTAMNDELAQVAAMNGIDYNARTGTFANDGERDKMQRALYKYQADDAKAAAKAESLYKEGKQFADSHRLSPTFEEEHRASWRERVPFRGNYSETRRPDMYNARGRSTSHQSMADRVLGSPEDWRGSLHDPRHPNPRVDNRWDPNGTRNVDNNELYGNPWAPPPPGTGGPHGGGPGGPPGGGPGPGGPRP